ncbi:hypothetical protein CYMTET_19433, partial [Cymbomonas tetramitiformis]
MKFKGELNENGVIWLQRRLIPVLERLGKEVILLLTPSAVLFIQDTKSTQGLLIHTIFQQASIFSVYRVQSRNEDKICVKVNASLFTRVLKSIQGDFERVEIKLVKRRVAEQEAVQLPFLNFSTASAAVNIVQDLPIIGNPFLASEVQEVERTLPNNEAIGDRSYYLDIQPLLVSQMQQVVEKLKNLNDVIQLATTQDGNLHLQADAQTVTLGSEYRGLKVLPQRLALDRQADDDESCSGDPATRLQEALGRGEAEQVSIRAKDLARGLLCQGTKPDRVLC